MPTHASANPEIKQLYINGHFCYVFKFSIITNGFGIICHISFYNKDFMITHPDIVVEKNFGSPDEDKRVHDDILLIPTLKDFFSKHLLINPKTFLAILHLIQPCCILNFLLVRHLKQANISLRHISPSIRVLKLKIQNAK